MTVEITPFVLGDYQTNCFVITSAQECWVIDCGYSPETLIEHLQSHDLTPSAILLTHCHADHIAGLDQLRSNVGEIDVFCHPIEAEWNMNPMLNLSGLAGKPVTASPPNSFLEHGQLLQLGDSSWKVVHAPGHSPGSVCFINDTDQQAIVGDTLFQGSIGRFDFPTSNADDLRHTISEVLMTLPDDLNIHPGHGPSSTIGQERSTNPFVLNGF